MISKDYIKQIQAEKAAARRAKEEKEFPAISKVFKIHGQPNQIYTCQSCYNYPDSCEGMTPADLKVCKEWYQPNIAGYERILAQQQKSFNFSQKK